MTDPIRVFVGTDESQEVAAAVLAHSVRSRTKATVEFTDLRELGSGLEGAFYTGFSFYRWAIPKLCGFAGRAIYVDADIVFAQDIAELWNLPFDGHTHLARPRPERDESFTSVMLLDCSRLSHWKFDDWVERAKKDADFYRAAMWCAPGAPNREGVGPLPAEWNHLDEWVDGVTKLIHYTKVRDQPWKRPGHPHEQVFLDALRAAVAAGAVTREQLLSDARAGLVYPGLLARVGLEPAPNAAAANGHGGSVATETVTTCPSCGSPRVERWCVGRDRLLRTSRQTFAYARCGACGVVFQSVRPQEDALARFYPVEYGPYVADGAGEGAAPTPATGADRQPLEKRPKKRPGVRRAFKRALADFYGAIAPGETFLDYGCGSGAYLDRARAAGLKTVGIDASPVARERAASKGHATYPDDPASWDAIPDGSVSFVRMNHVLEHLYRPREALRALAKKMAPGARFHAALPNPAGWSARMFRSVWHGLDCPRHAVLYPPKALAALLRDEGFLDVSVVPEPVTKDHLRSWGYVLEAIGWLKPGSAESVRNVRVLRRLLTLPSAIAVSTGRADRIHALARR